MTLPVDDWKSFRSMEEYRDYLRFMRMREPPEVTDPEPPTNLEREEQQAEEDYKYGSSYLRE